MIESLVTVNILGSSTLLNLFRRSSRLLKTMDPASNPALTKIRRQPTNLVDQPLIMVDEPWWTHNVYSGVIDDPNSLKY